jgi:hypothetical protein
MSQTSNLANISAWQKSAVQAAKHPDQKNDRQWDADEPQQQTTSHNSPPA